ncbi:MAG: GPW/gp25 family protein [Bacteroidota bacterium]
MSRLSDEIIGKGWAFPPSFDPINERAEMVTGLEDIKQSLHVLFSTQPGERVLNLDYGLDLPNMLFQNLSRTQQTMIEQLIKEAIEDYEPRSVLQKTSIDTSQKAEGKVFIQLDFMILKVNTRYNVVYPFFMEEGTLLSGIL